MEGRGERRKRRGEGRGGKGRAILCISHDRAASAAAGTIARKGRAMAAARSSLKRRYRGLPRP